MLNSKNIKHYAFALSLVMVASYVGNRFKQNFSDKTDDDYKMIRKYLLNETPLYGFNKPKIWIHTKYDINARNWKSFGSRNSKNLNQPYLHLTIQSIIDHCSKDFHICLIDDHTFSKLITGWDIDIASLPEPIKSQYRQIAMLKLVNSFGGMIVPNSFLCLSSLKSINDTMINDNKPFVCERINRTITTGTNDDFIPDIYFMGTTKNNDTVIKLIDVLTEQIKKNHHSSEPFITGKFNLWCKEQIDSQNMNLITGDKIGIRNQKHKPITIEDLMEDKYLELTDKCYGVYIPSDEILKRNKYNWFASLTKNQILKSNLAISYVMQESLIDTSDIYTDDNDKYKSSVNI